jgi:hypothetical protein
MPTWILLSPDKAHSLYRVPSALAAADGNYFYGMQHDPRDGDGPWPLVALLRAEGSAQTITLQIYTIEAEERALASFNPLTQSGGSLSLDKTSLTALAEMLSSVSAQGPLRMTSHRQMFQRLGPSQLVDLGFRTKSLADEADRYYRQVYDPLAPLETGETILIFSAGQSSRTSLRLYFKIAQFSRDALTDPSFDVLDDSIARINLDGAGARELARLLEAESTRLAS